MDIQIGVERLRKDGRRMGKFCKKLGRKFRSSLCGT
jgi:hypothetical protein